MALFRASFVASTSSAILASASLAAHGQHQSAKRTMRRQVPKPGKPPIVPPSKTMRYTVVRVPWMDPEDVKELLWRRQIYQSAVATIRQMFKAELVEQEKAGLGVEAMKEQERQEFAVLIAENEKHNEQLRAQREARRAVEEENLKVRVANQLESFLQVEERHNQQRTDFVEQIIAESANFVTAENLDAKIWEALENPVTFDHALDLNGKQLQDPIPVKYPEGTPTRQKGRLYDRTLGNLTQQDDRRRRRSY